MAQKPKDSSNPGQSDYDFSLECPEFRKRLLAELIERAGAKETLPLSDEELTSLNAAGQITPTHKAMK